MSVVWYIEACRVNALGHFDHQLVFPFLRFPRASCVLLIASNSLIYCDVAHLTVLSSEGRDLATRRKHWTSPRNLGFCCNMKRVQRNAAESRKFLRTADVI